MADEEQRVTPVVTGTRKVANSNLIKLKNSLINEDARNVKDYLIYDLAAPAATNFLIDLIIDLVSNGLNYIFKPVAKTTVRTRSASPIGTKIYFGKPTDYNGISKNRQIIREPERNKLESYGEAAVKDKAEGYKIIESVQDCIDSYGYARVADFNEAAGITGDYTDNNYGWTDISGYEFIPARIEVNENGEVHNVRGFILKMPAASPIKQLDT